jgi:hypothetical protein
VKGHQIHGCPDYKASLAPFKTTADLATFEADVRSFERGETNPFRLSVGNPVHGALKHEQLLRVTVPWAEDEANASGLNRLIAARVREMSVNVARMHRALPTRRTPGYPHAGIMMNRHGLPADTDETGAPYEARQAPPCAVPKGNDIAAAKAALESYEAREVHRSGLRDRVHQRATGSRGQGVPQAPLALCERHLDSAASLN